MADVGGFIKKLGWIGATLASNMPGPIGTIAQAVGKIVGKTLDPTKPADMVTAINGATPEQMIELQKLEMQHAETMQAAGFKVATDMLNIDAADRKSARDMQVATRDWTVTALAWFAVLSFIGVVFLMAFHAIPIDSKDTFLLLLGALVVTYKDVYGFFFGSSAGSQAKDKLLLQASPGEK